MSQSVLSTQIVLQSVVCSCSWSANAGSVSVSVLMLLNICCSHQQTKDKNASKVRQNMQCWNFLQLSCIVMGLVAGAMLGSKCWDNIKYANYSNPTWSLQATRHSMIPKVLSCVHWLASCGHCGQVRQLHTIGLGEVNQVRDYSIAQLLGLMILNYNFKRVTR